LNFPVEIRVSNNKENQLKAGMYGTAIFSQKNDETQTKPILVVSRDAFVGGLNSNQVFVVKDSIATLKKIVSGRNFGDKIEVLDGLKDGETVVVSGQVNLTDSAKVKIIK
jgi:multidrug efflux pump subunit AcrA (membrane-fusion protein)